MFARLNQVCLAVLAAIGGAGYAMASEDCPPPLSAENCKFIDRPVKAAWEPPLADGILKRTLPSDLRDRGPGAGEPATVPEFAVLSPEMGGVTSQRQPTLYWFLLRNISEPVYISLHDLSSEGEDVLGIKKEGMAAGLHRIDLSKTGTVLQSHHLYEFEVAIASKPQVWSRGGVWVEADVPVKEIPQTLEEQVDYFMGQRLWYDALEALEDVIAKGDDPRWQRVRAQLLSSEGLEVPASIQ